MAQEYSLAQIAEALGARLQGDPARIIRGIQSLADAGADDIAFLANPRYRKELQDTVAAAVILGPDEAPACPVDHLILSDPYLGYARLSHWFSPAPSAGGGIHPSAVIAAEAEVDPTAVIGANVSIGPGTIVEAQVSIGANCVIGADVRVGAGSRLAANVTLYHRVEVGRRALIHSGAVLGADGFGFARDGQQWIKIAQLGRVLVGDDVEIGANTTIDRGALSDTRVGNGVKLDNQIQIAHNVEIGDNTAIAGCVGIAGSTKIGRRCTIAGAANIIGHLEIGDDVHISANTLVTRSIATPGLYTSGTAMMEHRQWKRNVVRFRQLDRLANRVAQLEQRLDSDSDD